MQLIGDQGQHPLTFGLGGVTAFPAVPAELLQLVVQVSQFVFSIQFSVTDLPGSLGWQIRLRETVMGHNPLKPDNAWFEATRMFPVRE